MLVEDRAGSYCVPEHLLLRLGDRVAQDAWSPLEKTLPFYQTMETIALVYSDGLEYYGERMLFDKKANDIVPQPARPSQDCLSTGSPNIASNRGLDHVSVSARRYFV